MTTFTTAKAPPAADKNAEWEKLTSQQLGLVAGTRGRIAGDVPLSCEFCDEPAVWTTGDYSPRVACYDLRHIAMAESIGHAVPPGYLLDCLASRDELGPSAV